MTLPLPFQYPSEPHERKHGPYGYANYPEYKPWLRDEFFFRCVYCLEREMWYPNRASSFSVDHIEPRSKNPSRICDYDNLLYHASMQLSQAGMDDLEPDHRCVRQTPHSDEGWLNPGFVDGRTGYDRSPSSGQASRNG